MTRPQAQPVSNKLLAVVGVTAAIADGLLAVLGTVVWRAYRDGTMTAEQAGPFIVMGASAAAGAVLTFLAMIALLRGHRGRRLAQTTLTLTWLRLGVVVTALVAVALTAGIALVGVFGMAVAVGDALAGFVTTRVAARRTREASAAHRHG